MDRVLVYPGQIPLETDILSTNKYGMVGLSKLAAAVFGTSTLLNAFTCIPTGPASLQVQVTAGEMYSLQNIDGTAYSSLAADTTHQIMKQGILLDTVTLSAPAPGTGGQSINYLVQVAYSDSDALPVVLPYYNASNPSQAYSGPNNAGTTNNTVRKGSATVSIKAGVAATTGSQVTPAPDAGNTGMFVVTVANGQATITAGNISTLAGAPFITETLTQKISQAFADARYLTQASSQITAVAGGTADALTATFTPAITAVANQTILVRAASANATTTPTINPGSGAITIVKGNNLPLAVGDIAGAGHWLELTLDATLGKAVLQNPATGVSILTPFSIQGAFKNLAASASGTAATISVSADEIIVESAANAYQVLRNVSLSISGAASGANGLDDSLPQTVTVTIASPGVLTLNSHGFPANAAVVLATTGALPTGLTAGTTYYVTSPTTNTFQLSATKGGAAINTSGSQSGTHTVKSVLAASSWLSKWVIWNGTTIAGLLSSSATNPILPTGYTHKARTGWVYTDSSGNKYPLSFQQRGRRIQYVVAAGSNVAALPSMATGSVGSLTTPTWVAVPIGNFLPPTAAAISFVGNAQPTGGLGIMAAPNNSYGGYNSSTNPPPYVLVSYAAYNAASSGHFELESTNIYWASNSANQSLFALGWEDNI